MSESNSVRRTKEAIRQTFLAELETKPVGDIQAKELVVRAGVSRTTFYRYYTDVYALMADCFQTYCSGPYEQIPADVSNEEFSRRLFESAVAGAERVKQNRTLYMACCECDDPAFHIEFDEKVTEGALHATLDMLARVGLTQQNCVIPLDRVANICLELQDRLFAEWARGGCVDTCEQIARVINASCIGFARSMIREGDAPYMLV